MYRPLTSLLVALIAAGILAAGCAQAPAPAPTQAPAAPAKAAEATKAPVQPAAPTAAPVAPTKAPALQPTAAPAAKKVEWPEKGKSITIINPYPAGGPVDIIARTIAPSIEKDLGVPVQVVNKPGASTMLGTMEMVNAKADGYTIGMSDLPTLAAAYLDPESQAAFGRKDIQPLVNIEFHSSVFAVKADSPYKTLKDFVDRARANPEGVKYGTNGLLSQSAYMGYSLQDVTKVQLAFVNFDGVAQAQTALLGGHVDAIAMNPAVAIDQMKANNVRGLGIPNDRRNKFLPDLSTFQEQGFAVMQGGYYGFMLRAGTPREIVDVLSAAIKKSLDDPTVVQRFDSVFMERQFMDTAEFTAHWDKMEKTAQWVLDLIRKKK